MSSINSWTSTLSRSRRPANPGNHRQGNHELGEPDMKPFILWTGFLIGFIVGYEFAGLWL
jgi:hypothetical protein